MTEEQRERKREYQRKWRAANLEKVNEKERKWRAENPEKVREYQRKWNAENLKKANEQRLQSQLGLQVKTLGCLNIGDVGDEEKP